MSQANVDAARRGIHAFNRRDAEALAEFTTGDFQWFPALPGAVEGGGYRGREGIETYLAEIRDTWEELSVIVDDFRDLGARVLALGRTEGRGRVSGVTVDSPLAMVFDFRGGKIERVRTYLDHGEALQAAGRER